MIKFFHKLFNPHCDDCRDELRDSRICKSCETLRSQLDLANHEKKQLLAVIENLNNPKTETTEVPDNVEPLQPRQVPWRVEKARLEKADREEHQRIMRAEEMRAEELRQAKARESIDKLEKETGIDAS